MGKEVSKRACDWKLRNRGVPEWSVQAAKRRLRSRTATAAPLSTLHRALALVCVVCWRKVEAMEMGEMRGERGEDATCGMIIRDGR